nr:hypothetical protein [uncultured Sphingomonas sp.]
MFLAFAIAAALQVQGPSPEGEPVQEAAPAPTTIGGKVVDCETYHFETAVQLVGAEPGDDKSLKLCAYKGSTKASWLRTLRDARMKVAASDEVTTEAKARIDGELAAEIARVSSDGELKTDAPSDAVPGQDGAVRARQKPTTPQTRNKLRKTFGAVLAINCLHM